MYIGIDIGGNNIRVASFDSLEEVRIAKKTKFAHKESYQQDVEKIKGMIAGLGKDNIEGIGVGVPGVLNTNRDKLKIAANLLGWQDKPIKDDLTKEYGCQVKISNDTAAATLGEALYGIGKKKEFVFIVWGTGIGGAEVKLMNGKIRLSSFEPGQMSLDWDGRKHSCGQRGCWEDFCGGEGIERLYGQFPKDLSEENWQQVIEHFSQGLLNVLMIRPAKLVILAGGVAINQPGRIEQISKLVRDRLRVYPMPEIRLTEFREDIGLYGALALLTHEWR